MQYNHSHPVRMMDCGNNANTDASELPNFMQHHIYLYSGNPIRGISYWLLIYVYFYVRFCNPVMIQS